MRSLGSIHETGRSQSEVIGLVLVLGIVVAGASAVVVFGANALEDSKDALAVDRAQKTMTQFGSQAALVALGDADVQEARLPGTNGDSYVVNEDDGWMNVSIYTSGGTTEVFNESMGSLVYELDDTEVAYQGGGVWRSSGEGQALMVSPPDFQYHGQTLTLPLVLVRGDESVDQVAEVTPGPTQSRFPVVGDPARTNPVDGTEVNVTLRSEYYVGWGEYFETRTDGNVSYDHDRNVVKISLVPPFDETFDNAVATTASNGITINGADPPPSPYEEGADYPLVDDRIEEAIDECASNPAACDAMTDSITSSGTYYASGGWSNSIDVDNPGGNVTVVVDGDFDPGTVEVQGMAPSDGLTVFVRGDFTLGGSTQFNTVDGDASDASVLVHSDGDYTPNGNPEFTGVLYAPESACEVNGAGTIVGGIVCKTYRDNGSPASRFTYDPSVNDARLDLLDDHVVRLHFLHVTTNEIEVTEG